MQATHYDLHSHSIASDGTLTASQLVRRARDKGVDVLALTDHDTTDGLAEARAEAEQCGLTLINGVEISVTWSRQTIHILGLNIDPAAPELDEGLRSLREIRQWRAEEIGRRLDKAGIPDACQGAQKLALGEIVSRSHFARHLAAQGHAASMRDAFRRFLHHNRPGYVSSQWTDIETAVSWILSSGGQAVIAHPARYRMTNTKLKIFINEFRNCGGQGIEVVSGSHSKDDCKFIARLACESGLLGSQGSDYHGPENTWIELGKLAALPAEVTPIWSLWPAEKSGAGADSQPGSGSAPDFDLQ